MPTIAELMLAELEREAVGTRKALERVPDGTDDWKPHDKSMPLGYLATLVATMPAWIASMVEDEELDLAAPGRFEQPTIGSTRERLAAFGRALEQARKALSGATDEHLMTSWRLLMGGQVVYQAPRHIALRDSAINHWVHHRGQLTVYLRLNERPVPSLYGPSADERPF
jgi:uncharacterized damage-inducible protein DinB